MKLKIIKSQGSQNEFFIIDARNNKHFTEKFRSELAIALCQRDNWLEGADGILYVEDGLNTKYQMRIFNADGSEALMCGNGMRIMARWCLENAKRDDLIIENVTNLQYTVKPIHDYYKDVNAVSLMMPPAQISALGIIENAEGNWINQPISNFYPEYNLTAIAMPNPHIVAYVNEFDKEALLKIGYEANERKDIFPQGVNVSFAIYKNEGEIFVATYERGVGLTNACGTAMIASTVTGILLEKLEKQKTILVKNPGGFIQVIVKDDWSCEMIGNATYTHEAVIDVDEEDASLYTIQSFTPVQKEILAYQALINNL